MKPFRFGVNVLSAGSRAEWADKARKLEDLGYWALTVPDHLADIFAPMPALVSVAAATKTLRVGPRLLTLAAQEADIVGLSGVTFRRGGAEPDRSGFKAAGVDERLQLVREVAGDRYDQLELNA